jgi:hypothetical protein
MTAATKTPIVVTTWAGTVGDNWLEKAEELLNLLKHEYLVHSYKGIGNFGELKISSTKTTSEIIFKVDAKGRAKGVLRVMDEDTYVFLLFIMALSKVAPFTLADESNQTVRINCNPKNTLFKDLIVPYDELEKLGVLLGITISDKQRRIPGAAAFF